MFLSQGADGNIIIVNKEIYRQLVFTITDLVWGDSALLAFMTQNLILISRSSVPAGAPGQVCPDDAGQQLQQGEAGVPGEKQRHADRHQLEEGRRGGGGEGGED